MNVGRLCDLQRQRVPLALPEGGFVAVPAAEVQPEGELRCALWRPGPQHLLDPRERDVWPVQTQRAGVVIGFERLLKQQQRVHERGLAGAVRAGQDRQRAQRDLRPFGEGLEAGHDHALDGHLRAILSGVVVAGAFVARGRTLSGRWHYRHPPCIGLAVSLHHTSAARHAVSTDSVILSMTVGLGMSDFAGLRWGGILDASR